MRGGRIVKRPRTGERPLLRPGTVVKVDGNMAVGEGWLVHVFEVGERFSFWPAVEKLLDGAKKRRLAAAVFTIDQQISGIAKFEVVDGGSRKGPKIADLDLRDLHF